jgi:ferredoxin-type protein NapH
MAMVLVTALATGSIAWELVNPVTIVFRGLVFGLGLGWAVALAVFLFDLFVSDRGWCSRLCPVGAFYSLLGHTALVRVGVMERQACNDCMDCYAVCPEPQVIAPALKGVGGAGPLILAANCTNCGRCIDVCAPRVFAFRDRHGFGKSSSGSRIALNQG